MIQQYSGKAPYTTDHEAFPFRLLVSVLCFVEPFAEPIRALVDTASEWCVLSRAVVDGLGLDLYSGTAPVQLSTRFGLLDGQLERVSVTLDAAEGEPLRIDATCFVSEEWPGPMVIGWRGCLERMRFGFDTTEEAFYFGAA